MTTKEYNQCVELYADKLFRFMMKSCKDNALSDDLVQDAYMKLWLRVDDIAFEKAKSYLFSTAYHAFVDYYRRNKRQIDIDAVPTRTFSHRDQYSDLQEILSQAIDKLPDDQRSVILLRDYEGYSYEEIAEITQLSDSQVKVYIYRARLFLQNYLKSVENVTELI